MTEGLAEARKQSIEEIARYIFPIEVQELDEQDMDVSKSGDQKLVIILLFIYFNIVFFMSLASISGGKG